MPGLDGKVFSTYLLNELNVSSDSGILYKSSRLNFYAKLPDYHIEQSTENAAIGLNPASTSYPRIVKRAKGKRYETM